MLGQHLCDQVTEEIQVGLLLGAFRQGPSLDLPGIHSHDREGPGEEVPIPLLLPLFDPVAGYYGVQEVHPFPYPGYSC